MNSWTLKITHIKRKLKSLVSPTTGRVYVNLLEGNLYMVIVLIKKLLRGSVLLSFKNHAPLGCVSKTCMNHVSCVHMPGAGIGWMKIITKNHANGKQKSDGCRILRIASAICLRVSRALSTLQIMIWFCLYLQISKSTTIPLLIKRLHGELHEKHTPKTYTMNRNSMLNV